MIAWRALQSQEVAESVDDLRRDTLRFFLACAAAGYLAWHFISGAVLAGEIDDPLVLADRWALLPIVLGGLGLSASLLRRWPALAAPCFLATSLLSVTAAIWLLGAPTAALLYPLLCLVAVVLLHPLAGVAVGGCAVGLLAVLGDGPLAFVDPGRAVEVGVASALTVLVAWALGRNMVTAVEWSAASSARAVRNAEEARTNRAELAAALRQLDYANYGLQRANSALELAWAAAASAERARSEFVTNISHELRTPLNLIAGFAELMLTSPESYREVLPPSYRGDLNAIYRGAQHLLTLTNDVIDMARVGIGRLAIVREPVDLTALVEDACEIVRAYLEAKGLWLRIVTPADPSPIQLDRLRIRQVLLNLLTNAARFTEHGGITVRLALTEHEVRVEVRDTGAGIAPHDLPRVFTEFHHDGGTLDAVVGVLGGVGLGLPISKRMVELHGGRMDVESAVGRGTTFWFTLPRQAEPHPTPGRPADGNGRDAAPLRLHEAERIVILASAGGQLGQFVRRHLTGMRVVAVADLPAAKKAAVEHRAHAILVDSALDLTGSPAPEPAPEQVSTSRADSAPSFIHPAALDEAPVPILRLPVPDGDRLADRYGIVAVMMKPVSRADLGGVLASLAGPVRRVLIADDDPRFARLIARMLAFSPLGADVEVITAHNGQEALDLMSERRPDLALLDLGMPVLDGRQVIEAMRASPALADVPVIVMSAQDEIAGRFPLHGELAIIRSEGFGLEEALAIVEAVLGAIEPSRRYLTEPAPRPERAVGSS